MSQDDDEATVESHDGDEAPVLTEEQAQELRRAKASIILIAAVAFGGIVLMCLATAIIVLLRYSG